MRQSFAVISFGLFAACVAGASAWFKLAPVPRGEGVRIEMRSGLEAHTFTPVPLSEQVVQILSTTNLLNGYFLRKADRTLFTVFGAEWRAESAAGKTLINHTPDVCWVNSGWTPVALGQPSQFDLHVGGHVLTFECRVFRSPKGHEHELTAWCTLVNGESISEPFRFEESRARGGRLVAMANLGRLALGRLWDRCKQRTSAHGIKQFVRISTSCTESDPTGALEALRQFASRWLLIKT